MFQTDELNSKSLAWHAKDYDVYNDVYATAQPNQTLPFTLYWRCHCAVQRIMGDGSHAGVALACGAVCWSVAVQKLNFS